jgi:hypothetical protein
MRRREFLDVTFRVFARKCVAIMMTDIENLYECYAGDVRRFALYLCGDVAMADEICRVLLLDLQHLRHPVQERFGSARGTTMAAALEQFKIPKPAFQAFATTAQ